jgi:hypothetical protein
VTTAETALQSDSSELYLDRRIVTASAGRIDVKPARSIVFLPLLTLLVGLAAFPVIYFWGASLSLELRLLLTLAAVLLVPVSGIGLVYSIAGAHVVIDRAKQSLVLQQGYLGMGVGTQELVPFWKIDCIEVRELTPHDYRGHHEDFAQYEIDVLKLSGRRISIGTVTATRSEANGALSRAMQAALLIAEMTGSNVVVQPAPDLPAASSEGT